MKINVRNMAVLWLLLCVQPVFAGPSGNKHSAQATVSLFTFFMALSLLGLLLLITGFIYFLSRRKFRIQLEGAQKLWLSHEKDREQISSELHNTIGQNILFIRNQLVKRDQPDLITVADDTIEGIRNISHRLYPVQLERSGLADAVEALAEKARETSTIFISHDLEEVNLTSDQKINCYRIIQESIKNTVLHAEASAMRISVQQTSKGSEFVIQDNGKGFDKSILLQKEITSMGIQNIEARIKYLNGHLDLQTSPGNGTKFTYHIPYK